MRGIMVRPPGFAYAEDFIDEEAEHALLAFLSSLDLQPVTIRGNTSRRTTAHFGLRYDYGLRQLGEADPIPVEFEALIRRSEEFAGLANGEIVEALVNRYPQGASVGWHNDAPVYTTIIGVSLGSPCTMQFKSKTTDERRVFEQLLMPRSAYVMRDAARDDWQHRIPPTEDERYSVTLRSVNVR
jgi:DNA oxidative demethylase